MVKVPIAVVIEHYGANVPPARGGWQTIRCPFHEDRTASARINLNTQGFRCFACNINGDAIDVVMWREAKDFTGAVEHITGVIGAEVESLRGASEGQRFRTGISDEPRVHRDQRTIFQVGRRRRALDGG